MHPTTTAPALAFLLFVMGCGSPRNRAPAQGPSPERHSDPVVLDTAQSSLAKQQLQQLADETQRVSLRLEREGTLDQRERWQQELSDIEHDRKLLRDNLQAQERAREEDSTDALEAMSATIDALYAIGTHTLSEIDRALNGASGEATSSASSSP